MPANQDFLDHVTQRMQLLMPEPEQNNAMLQELMHLGCKQDVTTGKQSRSPLVSTQIAIESTIATMMQHGKLQAATCIIHTPRPSTPLLVHHKEQVDQTLVSSNVANDEKSKATVTNRVDTTRKLLSPTANIPMTLLYQESSIENLTPEQQEALKMNDKHYDNLELKPVDDYLAGENNGFTGATYLIKDQDGKCYAYSIQAYQSNSNDNVERQWGVWCGEYKAADQRVTKSDHTVGERIDQLQQQVFKPHGCDIEEQLGKSEDMQRSAETSVSR